MNEIRFTFRNELGNIIDNNSPSKTPSLKNTALLLCLVFLSACFNLKENKAIINNPSPTEPSLNIQSPTEINQFINNQKDGFWRTHFQNGQLKSEGSYRLGKKEGLHKQWEESGVLSLEGYYKNGKANGLMKWYHGEGHLAAFGNMIDDIRHGAWRICDVEDTGFCIDANFENGKRVGIWKINHEKAPDKIWKEQTWKDDKIVSERCWDLDGELIECEEW